MFFFLQLEMFDVCTMGDTAHSDTIFNLSDYRTPNTGGAVTGTV